MEKLLRHSSVFIPPHQKNFLAEVLLEKDKHYISPIVRLTNKMLAALLMLTRIYRTNDQMTKRICILIYLSEF